MIGGLTQWLIALSCKGSNFFNNRSISKNKNKNANNNMNNSMNNSMRIVQTHLLSIVLKRMLTKHSAKHSAEAHVNDTSKGLTFQQRKTIEQANCTALHRGAKK